MTSPVLRQKHNVWNIKYFAIAIGSMMVLFIIHHWLHEIFSRFSQKNPSQKTKGILRVHR